MVVRERRIGEIGQLGQRDDPAAGIDAVPTAKHALGLVRRYRHRPAENGVDARGRNGIVAISDAAHAEHLDEKGSAVDSSLTRSAFWFT